MLSCIPFRGKRLLASNLLRTRAWLELFSVLLISMPFCVFFRAKRQLTINLISAWTAPFIITMHFTGMPLCIRFRVKRLFASEVIRTWAWTGISLVVRTFSMLGCSIFRAKPPATLEIPNAWAGEALGVHLFTVPLCIFFNGKCLFAAKFLSKRARESLPFH